MQSAFPEIGDARSYMIWTALPRCDHDSFKLVSNCLKRFASLCALRSWQRLRAPGLMGPWLTRARVRARKGGYDTVVTAFCRNRPQS
jgi:hypothetical protein